MNTAPERDVVRIEELRGPRGGRTLVLHLSCGCFLTRSSRLPPPKRARCIPCSVLGEGGVQSPQLEIRDRIARKLVTIFHLYGGFTVGSRGPAGCIMDVLDIVAPEIANEVRELGADETYEKHWSHV